MGLVLRQGTGLALSISILPPGCSQKKVASLMNTDPAQRIDCYHVEPNGIRKVTVRRRLLNGYSFFLTVEEARLALSDGGFPQKPRVAPRMAVGVVVAQEVSHAHA